LTNAANLMELKEDAIRAHYASAEAMLTGFDHTPRIAKPKADGAAPERSPGIGTHRRFRSTTPGLVTRSTARPEGVHLIDRVHGADGQDPLPSPVQATVLQSLRRALAVAHVVSDLYEDQTGIADMKRDNLAGRLAPARSTEFADGLAASALISLFAFASMTRYLVSAHAPEPEQGVEIGEVEEVLTDNRIDALHGALWELDQDIAAHADSEAKLVAVIEGFCDKLMEKVSLRAQNAPRLGAFTGAAYRVEADEFTIDGFKPATKARSTVLTMSFKKPHQVVGNHIAKYQAMKLAKMLMAYDFERRMNPFAELGGFIFTFMGDGKPGTGKTTLIQMMAGLINDYCQTAGYVFRYRNLSIDNVDSYQGKSGQNARAFINEVIDPNVIGFGTVDDIDQVAGKRGDRQSSTGQQEITAVLMEAFAGANTVVRGNCTFGMFSNYPENVDDALRQRAGARFLVDGPQTREDYIDILHLLLGKNHAIPLGQHELFAAQEIKKAVASSFEGHARPHEDGLIRVFDRVETEIGALDTIAKLGAYLKAIKNITDAVKVRAMDIELPDEWMEKPDLFLFQPYERKMDMIRSMMVPITVEMVVQEINRYADSEFRYADKSDEVAIEGAVRDMRRMEEAKRRYLEGREK
jgi:energy-coupling factor transporter ATP-binding protein EcfA2